MKKLLVCISMFALVIAVGACDDETTAAQSKNEATAVQSADAIPVATEIAVAPKIEIPKDPKAVIVSVNDTKITEEQVSKEVNKRVEAQKARIPEGTEIPESQLQSLRVNIVEMLIEQELVIQKLAEKGIVITNDQALAEIKKIAAEREQTLEDVEEEIAPYGMTIDDLVDQIRLKVQMETLMKAEMGSGIVTDEDVKQFYDENPQYFTQPEQIKASHILAGRRGITEEEYPAELEKIKAAQARLKAGEAFEDVAKDASDCPSSEQGGDLGFFGKGQMDQAFEKAAFDLEVGQTSDIVKSSFGYHIIKVTDKREAGSTPIEEVKDQIVQFLTEQKQESFWQDYIQKMRDEATIDYSESAAAQKEQIQQLQQQMMQQQMMQQIQAQMQAQQAQEAAAQETE